MQAGGRQQRQLLPEAHTRAHLATGAAAWQADRWWQRCREVALHWCSLVLELACWKLGRLTLAYGVGGWQALGSWHTTVQGSGVESLQAEGRTGGHS